GQKYDYANAIIIYLILLFSLLKLLFLIVKRNYGFIPKPQTFVVFSTYLFCGRLLFLFTKVLCSYHFLASFFTIIYIVVFQHSLFIQFICPIGYTGNTASNVLSSFLSFNDISTRCISKPVVFSPKQFRSCLYIPTVYFKRYKYFFYFIVWFFQHFQCFL